MIFGRPTNLWLGLTTAISGALAGTLILLYPANAAQIGTIAGLWQGVLGAGIYLVANQPPTLNPGDSFKITTPAGQPSAEATVATPPASSPVDPPEPGG